MENLEQIPLSQEEKVAVLFTNRRCRHSGADPAQELKEFLLEEGFNNKQQLENYGLTYHFRNLKDKVMKNHIMLGLFLFGINATPQFIGNYIPLSGEKILLTTQSICRYLKNEYFTTEEITEICKQMPMYEQYFTYV